MEYKHLQTPEQFAAAAKQFKRYSSGLNEATLIGRIMPHLFLFADIPVVDDPSKALIPCQLLEFPGPFTSYDKFNKSLYTFVRSKRIESSQPFESELRFKCDLMIMTYKNALLRPLRDECATYPGVYFMYNDNAIAPFLSVEYKPTDSLADAREAIHQIAISSYVHLVERQRLYRRKPSPKYTEDPDIRHYAYTICGTAITIWVTSLRKERRTDPPNTRPIGYKNKDLSTSEERVT